jgi:DNA-binding GntR family transcriptional regulator
MAEPAPTPLEIVRTRSLASLVAQETERMILAGELPAGERINEQALAARLGVSRGPVREAVRGLERSGLVVTVVNQGSYVRKVSAEEALDLYDLRALLTGHACERLAARATPAQLARLEDLVRRMAAAQAAGDAAGYYPLNLDFHAALLEFAGNARARRIYEDLGNELHLFRRRALVAPENMAESNAEHAAILRAIAARDAAAAREAGERHIRGGKRRFTATSVPASLGNGVDDDDQRPRHAEAAAQGGSDGPARHGRGPPPGARVRAAGRAARRGGRG